MAPDQPSRGLGARRKNGEGRVGVCLGDVQRPLGAKRVGDIGGRNRHRSADAERMTLDRRARNDRPLP